MCQVCWLQSRELALADVSQRESSGRILGVSKISEKAKSQAWKHSEVWKVLETTWWGSSEGRGTPQREGQVAEIKYSQRNKIVSQIQPPNCTTYKRNRSSCRSKKILTHFIRNHQKSHQKPVRGYDRDKAENEDFPINRK